MKNINHSSSMSRPQTLAQKLIAKSAGVEAVSSGDILTCKVDLAMFQSLRYSWECL